MASSRWRSGDPSRQPRRIDGAAYCRLCDEPTDPERPNSPYCPEHRAEAARQARARYRDKQRQQRQNLSAARRSGGIYRTELSVTMTEHQRAQVESATRALVAHLERLVQLRPQAPTQAQWAAYCTTTARLVAELRAKSNMLLDLG